MSSVNAVEVADGYDGAARCVRQLVQRSDPLGGVSIGSHDSINALVNDAQVITNTIATHVSNSLSAVHRHQPITLFTRSLVRNARVETKVSPA